MTLLGWNPQPLDLDSNTLPALAHSAPCSIEKKVSHIAEILVGLKFHRKYHMKLEKPFVEYGNSRKQFILKFVISQWRILPMILNWREQFYQHLPHAIPIDLNSSFILNKYDNCFCADNDIHIPVAKVPRL